MSRVLCQAVCELKTTTYRSPALRSAHDSGVAAQRRVHSCCAERVDSSELRRLDASAKAAGSTRCGVLTSSRPRSGNQPAKTSTENATASARRPNTVLA